VILHQHPKSDPHQDLILSGVSPVANAYQVWSTSSTVFVSYLADRRTDTCTEWLQYLLCLYRQALRMTDAAMIVYREGEGGGAQVTRDLILLT